VLTVTMLVLAAAAGLTGAWSPCGFSMVETARGLAARAAFALGALAGGVVTFGGLSLIGSALGAGGPAALTAAALVAVAAAAGEARGLRIVPQIRRQVPESWRRILPLPVASAGYGVLLGLGFTTFVLSFAVWALAAVCVAVGDPQLGLVVGLAFGAGRALPVVVLAPGGALHAAMAERPSIYRSLRLADAVALLACAGALAASDASAATRIHIPGATDPASAGGVLVWHQAGGTGQINRNGRTDALPGILPTLGAGLVGWRDGENLTFADPVTLAVRHSVHAPGIGPFAFGERWVAWLAARPEGGDALLARSLTDPAATDRVVAVTDPPASLGRPAITGDKVLYHVAGRAGSRIVENDLAAGTRRVVRTRQRALLVNPSVFGDRIAYVRATYQRQELLLGPLASGSSKEDTVLYDTVPPGRRDSGHEPGLVRHRKLPLAPRPKPGVIVTLWTTALDEAHAYVTRLVARKGRPLTTTVLRADRPVSRKRQR
jgi:hypothetical protein